MNDNDELQEALKWITQYKEQYEGRYLTGDLAAAILAHIKSQDKRIAELKAALKLEQETHQLVLEQLEYYRDRAFEEEWREAIANDWKD